MGRKVLTAYERAFGEGELKKAIETAWKMREEGDSIEKIIRISGLSEDQLRENGIVQRWDSSIIDKLMSGILLLYIFIFNLYRALCDFEIQK